MRKSVAVIIFTAVFVLRAFGQEAAAPQALVLEDALRLALEKNAGLRAGQLGVQAADGRLLQAGAIPNPTLSAEVEDFGGKDELKGFDGSSTTIAIEQTIELGGKRTARRNVAGAETKLAEGDLEAIRLDVIKETTERFIDVLAAQEGLALSQEAWQIAQSLYQVVSNRVAAGKDSPVEEAKSRAELALARLALEKAKSSLAVSRKALCAMWSDNEPAFASVRGELDRVAQSIPAFPLLYEALTRSQGWSRWAEEVKGAEWQARAERRSRIPDLTVGAGIRQSQADGSQAFVASVGMELPIFDRKRGSVLAAEAELKRKRAEQEAAQTALRMELAAAHERLTAIQMAVVFITREALPAAEQAFAAAQASYAGGKIGYLDMQDARRLLVEMRQQRTETLVEYHRAVAQVERLAGVSLGEIKQK